MNKISRTSDVRTAVSQARALGKKIGFVPTMGYLHAGHRSLIERARKECGFVVVSIFVNPTQFGEGEDLDRYPRDFEADCVLCEEASVDIVFHPDAQEIYPPHDSDSLIVSYPELSTKLCGAFRPGHFDGVTTVMSKLLNIVNPDKCYLGKKDGQQLLILKRLVADSFVNVDIVGCPTVREADGLALSSRNLYLSVDERKKAAEVNKMLEAMSHVFESKNPIIYLSIARAVAALKKAGLVVQYFEFVDVNTLGPVRDVKAGEFLLCVAVMCGTTRLIDNYSVVINHNGVAKFDRGVYGYSTEKSHV